MRLPIATGPHDVEVFLGISGTSTTATFTVTRVVVDGAGPRVTRIEGTLSGAATGTLVAPECAVLSTSCV
jgi:hypothetical protein